MIRSNLDLQLHGGFFFVVVVCIVFFPPKTPIFPSSSLASLEQFLRGIREAASWAIVLSKALNKA